jgi:phosphatidate cytidylyltransferase
VLSQRIFSALVMLPLVVLGVLQLQPSAFAIAVALAMLFGAWEWSALVPLQALTARIAYLAGTATATAIAWYFARFEVFVDGVLWVAMAWWLFVLFWVSRPALGREVTTLHTVAKAFLGLGVLVSTWLALIVLHSRPDQGPHWVLYVLVLVWVADSGAFFVGKAVGHNKLAPAVSPGKTWEGVFGALLVSALCAFAYAKFLGLQGAGFSSFILVCVVTVMFSIVGDLLESLLKRQHGVKDSGTLIPGHGGILDRIDSLLAAAPVFLFGMRWIGL